MTDFSMGVVAIVTGIALLALAYLRPDTFSRRIPLWAIKCFAVFSILVGFLTAFFTTESEPHRGVTETTGATIGALCMAAGIYVLSRVFIYPHTFLPKIPRWAIKSFAILLLLIGLLVAFWDVLLKLV